MKIGVTTPPGYSLTPWRRDVSSKVANAAANATAKAADGARDDIRTAMQGQRLGKLSNVIGSTSDRAKKRTKVGSDGSFDIGGFVYAKIRSARTLGAIESYVDNETTTIRPGGKWLAIAGPEIPQKVGRRKMTPALYRSAGLESSIGPLVFVRGRHPGVARLVVDTTILRSRGGRAKATKTLRSTKSRARVSITAFILIRATRRSRRVDPRSIAARWQARLPQLIERELNTGARQGTPSLSVS
ncbi:hypothetical protein [Sphingomonas oligophenolica]|uniref:Uncharacterized protein n=1 Tax=Sphingomonas oligophenolica TaxID=301154 RepID=A0A502CJR6_9SPHN|nr:hypothetical protein [Sphingomonas oligophenolica]TPG13168.1 hypothetical protein EAH84_07145 [Sphingomonas oligophenolica]